jgi:methyl-accepting chemotaxis protein
MVLKFGRKKKVTQEQVRARLRQAIKKLQKREQIIKEKQEKARLEAKVALERGDERGFRVTSRRYSLIDAHRVAVGNLIEMAETQSDSADMKLNVDEIINIGEDLGRIQDNLGVDSDRLQDALSRINISMEGLMSASEQISTTIDSLAEASPEINANQETLRSELLTEIQTEIGGSEGTAEELAKKLKQVQEV